MSFRYNSAVEADVISGKLHPKLCHLKHLSVQFSANKIKSSEYFSKQPTQLIVALNSSLRHIFVTFALLDHPMYMIRYHFGRLVMCMCVIKPKIFSLANLKRVFVFVFVARVWREFWGQQEFCCRRRRRFKIHRVMMMMIACLNMAFAKDMYQA